ncbi:DUF4838 domain-containing protein [Cohnella abietis]|uniref:DUF4838 domain-containing protein n=1 Tax=Cohnella abietis TaxID=2507935 RepID=A0A3T1D734_9BACL|nr:DUF4838 domain-containing protein [Cohnella abietis]BBI33896.1 DUF4838 domain-containing protein [Cohnella abietis]
MFRELNLQQDNCVYVVEHDNQTIHFAAEELVRYLGVVSNCIITLKIVEKYDNRENGLWVGLSNDFLATTFTSSEQNPYDDEIMIDVSHGNGWVTGVNPRSVLLSVYRFLFELGCRWVRPGVDGEYLPHTDFRSFTINVQERASYRYRGICIEGAVGVEHITEMIDWMAKVGFNSYFIQFREAYHFFERWYSHLNNPHKSPTEDFDVESARTYVAAAKHEIQKRGMIYQAVGHGWTCAPFGIQGLSWEKWEEEIDPEIIPFFAQVNGKRELWEGIPINTELCYSKPEARSKMVKEIELYASLHPEVDLLHVWLSDGSNNQCECERCILETPSDLYIKLMNELDMALTNRGLGTRIVFLIYHELMWPPENERIVNPDRFVLQFAPITRTYRQSFASIGSVPDVPTFVRNKLDLPQAVEGNVSYLKAWGNHFQGDSFDFDYHFMWAHQKDPGYLQIAKVLYEDILHLEQLDLNGFVSCQVQRSFFPNGLPMSVMARTLWNKELSFSHMAEDYFISAYGRDGMACLEYAMKLSELYYELNLDQTSDRQEIDSKLLFSNVNSLIHQFETVIEKNSKQDNLCHASSWKYIKLHAGIWQELNHGLELLDGEDVVQAQRVWEDVKNSVWHIEDSCHQVFDVHNFVGVFDQVFSAKRFEGRMEG